MRHLRRQGNRAEKPARMRHSSKPFEIKSGERSLEFYHKFRDQFSFYKMDFGLELLYLEFLKLLFGSRLVLKAISICFPNKSADIYNCTKLHEGEERNTTLVGFRRFLRSIFARKNVN